MEVGEEMYIHYHPKMRGAMGIIDNNNGGKKESAGLVKTWCKESTTGGTYMVVTVKIEKIERYDKQGLIE